MLVQEVAVGPKLAPHLANNEVGSLGVLEGHVPRLDNLVELGWKVFGQVVANAGIFEDRAANRLG